MSRAALLAVGLGDGSACSVSVDVAPVGALGAICPNGTRATLLDP